jgi:cell wall-associated NlpC family hydrolase
VAIRKLVIIAFLLCLSCTKAEVPAQVVSPIVSQPVQTPIQNTETSTLQRLDVWTGMYESKGVPYVKGGNSLTGADCSGAIRDIYFKSGVPYPRTTAFKMYLIWRGQDITKDKAIFPDLVWYSFKKPRDHVAIFRLRDKSGFYISHASFSKQKFLRAFVKTGSGMDTAITESKRIDTK